MTLPFDRRLLELGIDRDVALVLFEKELLTMQKAARLAGMTVDGFMDLLSGDRHGCRGPTLRAADTGTWTAGSGRDASRR